MRSFPHVMEFENFINAEKDGWNKRADGYSDATALATLQIVPALLDALGLISGQQLLDVGCGPGHLVGAACALDISAQGIDNAPQMIAVAKQRFPNHTFAVADAVRLPFDDRSFDAVACNMGLFHMGDPLLAMREAARVLRPKGRFAFSQWIGPDRSALYQHLFAVLSSTADMSRADPAPNAYALSAPDTAFAMMETAGFDGVNYKELDTKLIATGDDFFDFFMKFGVRVPLIVEAQDAAVQTEIRKEINAAMAPYKTNKGFAVPMPCLLYSGAAK